MVARQALRQADSAYHPYQQQPVSGCRPSERNRIMVPLSNRLFAETLGTFWLVFGGCGSAVLAAAFPALGIGFAGVALAFGLTVLTMAYSIGHISGCISIRQ